MTGSSILSKPDTTVVLTGAGSTVANQQQRVLLVAEMDSGNGTATPGALAENTPLDDASIDALFGPKSQAAIACRNFRLVNEVTQLDVIPLDDTGTAATGVLTIAGTATEAGTIDFIIGSSIRRRYSIAVASGDTATIIGDNLVAAVTADARAMASASNAAGVVTLTASWLGLSGNGIPLAIEDGSSVQGVTAIVSTAMSGGTGDPSGASDFDVVADSRYQTVIYPSEWDYSRLTTFLDPRFNVANNILDGVGIITLYNTLANLLIANDAENSQSLTTLNFSLVADNNHRGLSIVETPIGISAQVAAARSLRLTDGALISDILAGEVGLDARGGVALASRPYFNTPFPNLPLIALDKGWSTQEIEQLGTAGGSTLGVNRTRTSIIAGEVFTTYKTDVASNPDTTFKFLNSVDTGSNAREYFFNNVRAQFAQFRLTDGDLVPNRSMANKELIRGFFMGLYRDLSEQDFVLTVAGSEAESVFSDNMDVTIDFDAGEVTTIFNRVPLVSQFRSFFGVFKIAFEV